MYVMDMTWLSARMAVVSDHINYFYCYPISSIVANIDYDCYCLPHMSVYIYPIYSAQVMNVSHCYC